VIKDEAKVDILFKINEDKVYRVRRLSAHLRQDAPATQGGSTQNSPPCDTLIERTAPELAEPVPATDEQISSSDKNGDGHSEKRPDQEP